jgi:hypothetical protein
MRCPIYWRFYSVIGFDAGKIWDKLKKMTREIERGIHCKISLLYEDYSGSCGYKIWK